MKNILCLIMFFFSYSSFSSDYEVEFFVTVDDRDLDVMEFSDEITLRQFKNNAN